MTYRELYETATRQLEHNEITLGEYEEMIKPLATEVRKVGKWEKETVLDATEFCESYIDVLKCSECGYIADLYIAEEYKYCPNCGSYNQSIIENER